MDYEKKLREYISSLVDNPSYRSNWKEWAFGAVDFACQARLINPETRNGLQDEYKLLDN